MNLSRVLTIGLLAAFLFAGMAGAGTEVMEIDPLADKDLYHFKKEGPGQWKIDDTTDDIDTLIVCGKSKEDTGLLFIKRTFLNGFRLTMDVLGGSKYKGLEFWLVPPEGDRIQVPFSKRWLAKKGWHRLVITLEKGKVQARVGDEKGETVEVPEGLEYTFALKLLKRSEAMFRKPKIKFLVVSQAQAAADEGFVRIFDGASPEGWTTLPDKPEFQDTFKIADQRIEGKLKQGPRHYVQYMYKDAVFRDYIFKFKASADTRGLHLFAGPGAGNVPGIDDYFARDRDWNQVEWESKNQHVTLKINGNMVWQVKLEQNVNVSPQFFLLPGGKCTVRDIQVKGQNLRPGPTWARYAAASGVAAGGGAPAGGPGGGTEQPHPGGDGGGGGPATRQLFNGTDLTDWGARPSGAWTVEDNKVIGMTFDMTNPAELIYQKLVFTDYRLVFKVQRGTAGAKFVARAIPPADARKAPILVEIKEDWLKDKEWNEFEAVARDSKLTIKVNGKEVYNGAIHVERGFIGWTIAAESAIGLSDIVWHRPR